MKNVTDFNIVKKCVNNYPFLENVNDDLVVKHFKKLIGSRKISNRLKIKLNGSAQLVNVNKSNRKIFYKPNINKNYKINFDILDMEVMHTPKGEVIISKQKEKYLIIHDHLILRYMERTNVHTYSKAVKNLLEGIIGFNRLTIDLENNEIRHLVSEGMLLGKKFLYKKHYVFYFKTFITNAMIKEDQKIEYLEGLIKKLN